MDSFDLLLTLDGHEVPFFLSRTDFSGLPGLSYEAGYNTLEKARGYVHIRTLTPVDDGEQRLVSLLQEFLQGHRPDDALRIDVLSETRVRTGKGEKVRSLRRVVLVGPEGVSAFRPPKDARSKRH